MGASSTPQSPARQYEFFMSYAPATRLPGEDPLAPDNLATEFFSDLSDQVRRSQGLAPKREVGYFGPVQLPPGVRWRDRVGRELAACRVFVPLYSPHYFASPMCERELSGFLQRAHGAATPEVPIVPLVWAPTLESWPSVPRPLVTFGNADVDARYSAEGLYGLMALRDDKRRRSLDGAYGTAVRYIGQRIVQLAATSPIPLGGPVDLDTAPDAFARKPVRSPLGLHILAPTIDRIAGHRDAGQYGRTSLDWNPYRQETPNNLTHHMSGIARKLGYRPVPRAFDAALDDLLDPVPGVGPAVLVVDPWALDDKEWRARLREFDQSDIPWVGVVVAWDPDDPQTARAEERLLDQVHATLLHRFARRRIAMRLDAGVAATLTDFGRALLAVIQEAATQYIGRAGPLSDPADEPRVVIRPVGPTDQNKNKEPEANDG